MDRITVTQLRSDLDGYLEKVRNGESLLILDHGRPIARLNCMDEWNRLDDRLARLEREGLVRRAVMPLKAFSLATALVKPISPALAAE